MNQAEPGDFGFVLDGRFHHPEFEEFHSPSPHPHGSFVPHDAGAPQVQSQASLRFQATLKKKSPVHVSVHGLTRLTLVDQQYNIRCTARPFNRQRYGISGHFSLSLDRNWAFRGSGAERNPDPGHHGDVQ